MMNVVFPHFTFAQSSVMAPLTTSPVTTQGTVFSTPSASSNPFETLGFDSSQGLFQGQKGNESAKLSQHFVAVRPESHFHGLVQGSKTVSV